MYLASTPTGPHVSQVMKAANHSPPRPNTDVGSRRATSTPWARPSALTPMVKAALTIVPRAVRARSAVGALSSPAPALAGACSTAVIPVMLSAMSGDRPLRVGLLCSGLDHARRGFESFARECLVALRAQPAVDVRLLKGSGPPGPDERAVPTVTRDAAVLRALGRATGREPFRFEQVAFALGALPAIARSRPDVLYFSEWHT